MIVILDLGNLKIGIKVDTADFNKAMQDVQKSTESVNSGLTTSMTKVGDNMTKVGKTLSTTVTAPVVGFATAIGKISVDFEKQMSSVQAISGASGEELKQLEEVARQMGATTKYSATESAQALEYLALAGYSVEDSISTLPKVLALAQAGNIDLAYASDLVTDISSALNLKLEDTDELLDKMAKSSSSSNMSVAQVGEAMLTVGGTANTLSGGITEVNTALGILANNGVKGSEGGTALRNTILSLTAPTDKAKEAMEALGIQVSDAEGNMLPLDNIMKQFNSSLAGLGKVEKQDTLNKIFNKVDLKSISALMASTVVNMDDLNSSLSALGIDTEANAETLNYLASTFELNEDKTEFCNYAMQEMGVTMEQAGAIYDGLNKSIAEGSSTWSDLQAKIDGSNGACQEMADIMNDNLDGTLKTIGSALEELALQFGEILLPVFKKVAVGIIELIQHLQGLDENTKKIIAVVASIMAVLPPVLVIGGKLIKGISSLIGVVTKVSTAVTEMGGVVALLTNPITIAIGAITALVATIVYLYNTNEEVREAIDKCWDSIKKCFESALEYIKRVVNAWVKVFKELWSKYGDDIKEIAQKMWDYIGSIFKLAFDLIGDIFNVFSAMFKGDWNELWQAVAQLAKNLWDNIISALGAWLDLMVTTVKNIGGALFNAGKSIFTSMWDGLKSVWTSISNWVGEKVEWLADKLTFWNNSASKMDSSKIKTDGSHRNGLEEVPYDGYVAQLHKGERVLTRSEADRYNKQQSEQTIIKNTFSTVALENKIDKLIKVTQNQVRQQQIANNMA